MTGFLLTLTLSLAGADQPGLAQKNGWHADYQEALAEARQRGRLLFVVFR
jgi:hypothetical protein